MKAKLHELGYHESHNGKGEDNQELPATPVDEMSDDMLFDKLTEYYEQYPDKSPVSATEPPEFYAFEFNLSKSQYAALDEVNDIWTKQDNCMPGSAAKKVLNQLAAIYAEDHGHTFGTGQNWSFAVREPEKNRKFPKGRLEAFPNGHSF